MNSMAAKLFSGFDPDEMERIACRVHGALLFTQGQHVFTDAMGNLCDQDDAWLMWVGSAYSGGFYAHTFKMLEPEYHAQWFVYRNDRAERVTREELSAIRSERRKAAGVVVGEAIGF